MSSRVFYVVYFRNQDLQRALDAILLICDPNEKNRAHITIRGPYTQRRNVAAIIRRIRGSEIDTIGVDCFFKEDQNTVFIGCESDALREVSKKRDYSYNPHITLYDGASRAFADELLKRLSKLNLDFPLLADGVSPLVSTKKQSTLDLRTAFDEKFTSRLLGRRLTVSNIENLTPAERLFYAEELSRMLPELSARSPKSPSLSEFIVDSLRSIAGGVARRLRLT